MGGDPQSVAMDGLPTAGRDSLAMQVPPARCSGGWRGPSTRVEPLQHCDRDHSGHTRSGASCGVSLSVHFARSPSCAVWDTPRGGSLRNEMGASNKKPRTFQRGF